MSFQKMNPILVTANPIKSEDGLIRIDVNIGNVPENLFGAAFHLKIQGSGWKLIKTDPGEVFGHGAKPILMVAERHNVAKSIQQKIDSGAEIIFGLSLKNGDVAKASDGKLVSFYIKPEVEGDYKFVFTDHFLTLNSQPRQDLVNVNWKGSELKSKKISESLETQQSQQQLQANLLQTQEVINAEGEAVLEVYGVLVTALVIFLIILGFLALIQKTKE